MKKILTSNIQTGSNILNNITLNKAYEITGNTFVDDADKARIASAFNWIDVTGIPKIPKHGDIYITEGKEYEFVIPQAGHWELVK